MKNIMIFGLLALAVYWVASLFFHFPMFGAFLFVPLLLCMLMMMFMHGDDGRAGSKTSHH